MQQITKNKIKRDEALSIVHGVRFDGELLTLCIHTHIGRMCAKLCAYMLLAVGEKEAAATLFKKVGH